MRTDKEVFAAVLAFISVPEQLARGPLAIFEGGWPKNAAGELHYLREMEDLGFRPCAMCTAGAVSYFSHTEYTASVDPKASPVYNALELEAMQLGFGCIEAISDEHPHEDLVRFVKEVGVKYGWHDEVQP